MMLSEQTAQNVRSAAVAGMFYPSDPQELESQIDAFLHSAQKDRAAPKAMIVPHAWWSCMSWGRSDSMARVVARSSLWAV